MTYLRAAKCFEGKRVIINDQLEAMFGLDLQGIMQVEGVDDQQEEMNEDDFPEMGATGEKRRDRTEASQVFKKVDKKDFQKLFMKNMQDYHKIVDPDQRDEKKRVLVRPGRFPKVKIIAEKSKNRFVTRLSGLEPFNADLKVLSSHLSNRFACSCSVHVLSSGRKGKTREVVMQGTFSDELKLFLVQDMKLEESLIEEINKEKNKKKKPGLFK